MDTAEMLAKLRGHFLTDLDEQQVTEHPEKGVTDVQTGKVLSLEQAVIALDLGHLELVKAA